AAIRISLDTHGPRELRARTRRPRRPAIPIRILELTEQDQQKEPPERAGQRGRGTNHRGVGASRHRATSSSPAAAAATNDRTATNDRAQGVSRGGYLVRRRARLG